MSELDLRGATQVGEAPQAEQEIDLRGAEPVTPAEPGIVTSVKRGWQQANAGREATNMANLAAEWKSLEGDMSPEGAKRKQELLGGIEGSMGRLREASSKADFLPKSEGQLQFEAAQGWIDPLVTAARSPWQTITGITAESIGSQGKTLPLIAAAGIAGGIPGLAFATGVSSTAQEYDSGTLELLTKLGTDMNDPAAVARAMTSPEFKAARADKLKKAATIGAVDAATSGVVGLKLGSTPVKNIAAQTGVQMVGGGAGELAGEIVGGEEISPSSIYAEALGEIPGGLKDVGTHSLHKMITSQTIAKVAEEAGKQAATGFNTEEQKTADDVVGSAHKQKLTPLQAKVFMQAAAAGVNPQAALTIVGIESNFNPGAKNADSSAHGLFQQIDSTWEASGGGDRNNVDQQIANGLRGLMETQAAMEKRLGRNVSPEELYYGHLLGPRGGIALAIADSMDPQGKFLDLVKSWDAANAEAIVKNNGLAGLTNEQAARKLDGMYQRKSLALGNDEVANRQTRASPLADTSPNESIDPQSSLDENVGLEDLDAMFAAVEDQPLSKADIDAALAEDTLHAVETGQTDAQTALDATMLDDQENADPAMKPDGTLPRLPRELAGAAPKYGFANQMFAVDFASDVDRAAYIIANEAKKSARDAEFLQFVMDNLGVDEAAARQYGKEVRAQIRELAKAAKGTAQDVIRLEDRKRAESWVSLDEQGTRERYNNPNDDYRGKLSTAPVVAASDENVGMPLRERSIAPGEVVAVGKDSTQTPLGYMQAAQQTLQEVIGRFAPNAKVVLTFMTEPKGVVSSQSELTSAGRLRSRANGLGLYRINLRNATNLGVTQDGTANPTTQRKITYAAYHEAGHVIANEQMLQGMSPAMRERFRTLGTEEYFSEAELASLSPEQANVLREYNQLKWQALNDPNFTAEDFAQSWLSPWKLGHGAGNRQGLFSFVKQFLGQATVQRLKEPARNFALQLDQFSEALSPHEYMAEQFARYAYSSGMAEASPLSRSFFQRALDTLRQFFKAAKGEGAIKPGVAFAEWVDSLTQTTQRKSENVRPMTEQKAATKAEAAPAKTEEPSLLPPAITAQAERNIATVRGGKFDAKQQANFALLGGNLAFVDDENPALYKHWSELISAGRLEDFRSEVAQYVDDEFAEKYVRYDRDSADYQHWQQVNDELGKAVPARAELKRWLPSGLRNLSNAKYFFMTLEQMSMRFPEVAGIQALALMKTNYKAFKAKLEFKGLEVAQSWSKLGKEQHGLLERAMKDEHAKGEHLATLTKVNGALRFVPNEALVAYANSHGLDESTVKVWLDAKNAHLSHMNALQNVIARKMQQRYAGRPATLKVKMHELSSQFEVIRGTPFLPQTRFGQYALRIVEDGLEGRQTVHVEFYESAAMRDEAMAAMKKVTGKYKALKVEPAFYRPASAVLRTLPPQILTTWADELELTNQERKELREIADSITRNPSLRKYSLQLAQITGANKDLLRGFGDFMWHSSNAISKTLYREHMKKAVLQIEADMQDAAHSGDVQWHDELIRLRQFAADYVDHMMSPQDEWQKVRAFAVYKQLWGNIKTALANLNSLYSIWALASRQQGLVQGTAKNWEALAKVSEDSFARASQRVLRRPVEGSQVFGADTRWALDQARQDGLLDESFAAQLANFANAGTLSRLNFQRGDSLVKKVLWLGMQPQHLVERYVREVGLVTHFEFYKREGLGNSEAYLKARNDVIATQGDNSLLNRPAFMRGKYSKFLIYYGYMQQQLYLFSGAQERARNFTEAYLEGKTEGMSNAEARKKFFSTHMGGETLKIWLAYLALGGLMGMPGAEDLGDILELLSKKFFGTRFSLKEYAYKLAASISEEASSYGVDVNPRSIVHGTFSDFSPLWIGPAIDLSGSMSMGRVLPGGSALAENDPNKAVVKLLGPLGGAIKDTWEGAFGDDPNKRFGYLPTAGKNLAETIYNWEKGVQAPSGGKITIDRKTGAVRDLSTGEKLAQMMSFTPEIVSANKEVHWMQRDVQVYWTSRRNQLMGQVAEAQKQGDREAIADSMDALSKFNENAPPHVGISPRELRLAMKRKQKAAALAEQGLGKNKRFRQLDREIADEVRGTTGD